MSAAVILARQNRFMRLYSEAQATSPASALAPEQLGIRRSWIFNRMERAGVFVHVGQGRYYLDLQAAEAFRAHRRFKALVALGIFLLIGLFYFIACSFLRFPN